ncbi:MAG: ATP-binding protein [Rhodocyclaceae bacterium]
MSETPHPEHGRIRAWFDALGLVSKFLAVSLPSIGLFTAMFCIALIGFEKHSLEAQHDALARQQAERDAFMLSRPLWNFDRDTIDVILASLAARERIFCTQVRTTGDASTEYTSGTCPEHDRARIVTASIHYTERSGNPLIGTLTQVVDVGVTPAELLTKIHPLLILTASLAVVLSACVLIAFRIILIRPLTRVAESVQAFRDSGMRKPVDWHTQDELGSFIQQYNEGLRHQEHVEAELLANMERTREALQDLKVAKASLVQSEKLASIGQLAAGVAHEINNPIGYVHSNIGSLEQYIDDLFRLLEAYEAAEPALAPPQAAALAALRQQLDVDFLKQDIPMLVAESKEGITRVKKIVQDLKDFSHVDAHQEWQWTDLRIGLDSTLNIVNNEIKYKADVVRDYADIPEVECLPSQLNQVFMNLLVNAAHAMGEERGTITVRARQPDPQHVAIEIADDGCGIPDDVRQKIFDPFFTTKPIGKGTGLGLSLSYGIVQNHNGRIEVESTTGVGTVFRVVLPISHRSREETA